ncbi:MAG TPA: response regulator, partial [Gemmatimonadales bacterium]
MAANAVHKRLGYIVLEAKNGKEGLAIAERYASPIHLALSDIVMPGMDGREFIEKLYDLRPTTRVLLMSGYAGDAIARRGPLSPDIPLLNKPFSARSLGQKVREVLDAKGTSGRSGPDASEKGSHM